MSCSKKCEPSQSTGELPSAGRTSGSLRRLAENILVRRAKRMAEKEMTERGFESIRAELVAEGFDPSRVGVPLPPNVVEEVMTRAAYAGLTDEAIIAYAESDEVGALGDGKILQILRNIVEWVSDPANQEKLVRIAKFIMMMAAIFGL